MSYLSDKHSELASTQQSSFMQWFGGLSFDKKIANIGVSLTIGITSAAIAWTGESSNRIYFCLRTPQNELRCVDNHNRPYRMTLWHWQQWKKDGMPTTVVPNEDISPKGLVKASNSLKPLWAVGAFAGFASAGWMLRHLQDDERKLANFQTVAEKRDVAKAELKAQSELMDNYREVAVKQVELQADLDLVANDRTVDIQKAEILGETEILITQMEAKDAVFEAETAGMSEEQRQEYI